MKVKRLVLALFCTLLIFTAWPRFSQGRSNAYNVVLSAYTCENNVNNPMYPCGSLRWGGNVYSRGLACLPNWRNQLVYIPYFGTYRCDDTMGHTYARNGWPRVDIRVPTLAEARRIGVRYVTVYHVDGYSSASSSSVSSSSSSSSSSGSSSSSQAARWTATPTFVPTATSTVTPYPTSTSTPYPTSTSTPYPTSTSTPYPTSTSTPYPTSTPTATLTPTPDRTTRAGILQIAQAYAPNGDASTAMVRLAYAETAQKHLPELVDQLQFYDRQHVWMITMWVPPTEIPYGTYPKPNADGQIMGQFFLFDAHTGNLMTTEYISGEVLSVMGWLPDDAIDLRPPPPTPPPTLGEGSSYKPLP